MIGTRTRAHVLLAACMYLLVCSGAFAGDNDALPADTRESLVFGIGRFDASGIPVEYQYLGAGLPLLLMNELHQVPERVQTEIELSEYARRLMDAEIAENRDAIGATVRSRDELLFDRSLSASEREKRHEELSGRLSDLRERRDLLAELSRHDIALRDTLPIERSEAMESGELSGESERLGRELDLKLSGRLTYETGYILLRLWLDVALIDGRIEIVQRLIRPGDVVDEVEDLSRLVARTTIGRPFGSLRVATDRSDASVVLDGELIGFGETSRAFLEPGEYRIDVAAAGYRDVSRTVTVESMSEVSIDISLERRETHDVEVVTTPPGADLFVGSEWIGRTPVQFERPIGPRTAELRLADHRTRRIVVEPTGAQRVSYRLSTLDIDPSVWLRERREGFYRSLGWLAVSLPVPIILSGAYQNQLSFLRDNFTSLSQGEQERRIRALDTTDAARWGGVVVSGGLLINSVIQLVRYIQAGEYYHFE